jgi:Cu(I)/Ag(I) efflux system membrane fusion protein
MRLALLVLIAMLAGCSREAPAPAAKQGAAPAAAAATAGHEHAHVKYHCPMHPDIVRDAPGKCPICGMTLVAIDPMPDAVVEPAGKVLYYRHPHDPNRRSATPMKDEMGMDYVPVMAEAVGGEVRISPAVVNNLGVRTEAAAKSRLPRRIEATGYVSFDERRVQQVRTRAEGWVEGLAVRAMGETVQKGQLLFTLYSPMLATAQAEYADAQRIGNRELIDASRDRLKALGLDGAHANKSGRVAFYAPVTGVVTELEAREGAMVTPEMVAMTITGDGSLWVIAEVPESQSGWLRTGAAAEIRIPSLPGEPLTGRVEYVYPELNMETRTVKARIALDRPPAVIRANMLASVSLTAEEGDEVVNVPRSALIRSGTEERVVVALGDGRFAARKVVAGVESGDRVAIRDGLAEGERVVVSGQFLLDSEANLRSGLDRLQP